MTFPTSPAAPQPPPPPVAPRFFASVTQEDISVDSLVKTSFAVWWKNIFRFAGLTLLVFVPLVGVGIAAAIALPAMARRGSMTGPGATAVLAAIIAVVALTMFVVQMGGLTYGAVQHLANRPVRFGAMLGVGFRRALPLLGAAFLMYLAVLGGLVLLVVPGVLVGVGLAVVIPAAVVERVGPVQALRRSWELTRGHQLTIFGAWLVLLVIMGAANVISQVSSILFGPLWALILFPVQLLLSTLPVLLPAVAYHDLRAAKEGTATEELARVFE